MTHRGKSVRVVVFLAASVLVAGMIVDHFGYSAGFVTLGLAALVAAGIFFFNMPETSGNRVEHGQDRGSARAISVSWRGAFELTRRCPD